MKNNKISSSSSILLLLHLCIMIITTMAMDGVTDQGDILGVLLKRKASMDKMFMTSTVTSIQRQVKVLQECSSKERDMITILPGQPAQVNFTQYSGYITVDVEEDANLFYYFAEAPHPSDKPLLLWLNGGPGCSSLIGALQEIGPFRVKSDGRTLFQNPYAWNNVANVLFLENTVGVGFSYPRILQKHKGNGDKLTAHYSYYFLINWLERFPEYKGREFYIAGESYAGHYIPNLATLIHQSNQRKRNNNSDIDIKLKGIMIGNPSLDDQIDARGYYDYLWTHAILSDETIDAIHKYCDFKNIDFHKMRSNDSKCNKYMMEVDHRLLSKMDFHNIYAPKCRTLTVTKIAKIASIGQFDPCSAVYAEHYLNLPEVQKALHIRVSKLDDSWAQCSSLVHNWTDSDKSMLPILKDLINSNIRVWIYSGDIDARIPVTSTRYSLAHLNLKKENSWRAWMTDNYELAGFSINYEKKLTFVTVKGAGHKVPSDQPARSLELVKHFLQGNKHLSAY